MPRKSTKVVTKTSKRKELKDTPTAPESKEGHPPKPFKAEPLILVEPPKEAEKVCSCEHKKAMHYGGAKGHCNTPGCPCLEFK